MNDLVIFQRLLGLSIEKQFRCGDGGRKATISHSINCACERIDKEIKEQRKKLISAFNKKPKNEMKGLAAIIDDST